MTQADRAAMLREIVRLVTLLLHDMERGQEAKGRMKATDPPEPPRGYDIDDTPIGEYA